MHTAHVYNDCSRSEGRERAGTIIFTSRGCGLTKSGRCLVRSFPLLLRAAAGGRCVENRMFSCSVSSSLSALAAGAFSPTSHGCSFRSLGRANGAGALSLLLPFHRRRNSERRTSVSFDAAMGEDGDAARVKVGEGGELGLRGPPLRPRDGCKQAAHRRNQ